MAKPKVVRLDQTERDKTLYRNAPSLVSYIHRIDVEPVGLLALQSDRLARTVIRSTALRSE
jgi:hypothetical protein